MSVVLSSSILFSQSVCCSVSPSVVLSVNLLLCQSVCSSVSLSIFLSVRLFSPVSPSVCPSVRLLFCLFVCFFHHSICWSVSLIVSLQVRLLVFTYRSGCYWYVSLSHLDIHNILNNFKKAEFSRRIFTQKYFICIYNKKIYKISTYQNKNLN